MSAEFEDADLQGLQSLPEPPVVQVDDDDADSDEYDNVPRTRSVILCNLFLPAF